MILRWKVGSFRITFTIAPVTEVVGVNSKLPDGNHILMWDFDEIPLTGVRLTLGAVQHEYKLPPIYVLQSNPGNHYIAYSLAAYPWEVTIRIIAATPFIDMNFFKYGVYRGHFTLRVSAKNGSEPRLAAVLESPYRETARIPELRSWTKYETLRD